MAEERQPITPRPRFLDEPYVLASVELAHCIETLEHLATGGDLAFPPALRQDLLALTTRLRHLRRRVILHSAQPSAQTPLGLRDEACRPPAPAPPPLEDRDDVSP
jgi:hypothetical protein